ncbi:MAG: dicarboxylate transporter, DctP subunit [Ramlibacter sp.]|nr:dicarboxylate transporter, DctP subunit [Ramlibacter sp.]
MFAALLVFGACAQQLRAEPVTLDFALPIPEADPAYLIAVQFAKRVEARSGGPVKVEIFPAAQLGSQTEVLQKVKLGAIDITATTPDYLIKYEKAFAVLVMPYVFDSYEHAHRVLDGPAMSWLAPLAEKQGFVILSNLEWGFRNLTNNKRPINRPEDVRGLLIRVPPVAELEDTMEALGAQVSKIGANELYQALSQGEVDGQENPLNAIYYGKLYRVQKHLALTRHAYYNSVLLISAQSWAKLTAAQQIILREESKALGDAVRKRFVGQEEELIARMADAGLKVTHPDAKPFRALMEPAYRKIKVRAGEDNVRRFLKMVDDERGK